jgi:hypothetical protein
MSVISIGNISVAMNTRKITRLPGKSRNAKAYAVAIDVRT